MMMPIRPAELCTREKAVSAPGTPDPKREARIAAALLTGGSDRHYTFGLAMALVSKGVWLDVIGSDEVDSPEMHTVESLTFLNLRGSHQSGVSFLKKVSRVLLFYARLIGYAWAAKPRIFHILWNNKFQFFDRTLLMLYYKIQGKKIVLTAHNVNQAKRDHHDSLLNRLTLRIQYHLADHIFVHTEKMKDELHEDYGVSEQATTVIPFGVNNAVPHTPLTCGEAKQRLGISDGEKTILFFGNMRPSKGLEYLLAAFQQIVTRDAHYRLIIAGQRIRQFERHWADIQQTIRHFRNPELITLKIEFVPDDETELYFKAADVLVLPYTEIFQSGVLFLGYSFGLPVIATAVGSFREDIIEGQTGFLCRPRDPVDLARTLEAYFESDLFRSLNSRRKKIQDYVNARHSWDVVAEMTRNVYAGLLGVNPS